MRRARAAVLLLSLLVGAPAVALWAAYDSSSAVDPNHTSLFNFVRIRYNGYLSFGGRRFGREPPWRHDYPYAEQNFLKILSELTSIETTERSYLILDADDPEVMKYPMLYVSEPGYWNCTEAEIVNLREYLQRGGFIVFDDFRDDPGEWQAFSGCMREVMPEHTYQPLTIEHPIFHCFYDIETLHMTPPYGVPGMPTFYGLSDENGRLMSIANFNNDLGDYWEWSDQSIVPIALSNEAYKFGVNYAIYAMSH